jgi:NitT/TauT family transport system ATP-binding protein
MTKIAIDKVRKLYPLDDVGLLALDDVHLDIEENQFLSIVGPSGCGKTTLLNLLAGLDSPTSGTILINEKHIDNSNLRCGFVFQIDSVFPWLSVRDNIGYGLRFSQPISEADRALKINQCIRMVGLEEFANRWPRELSGGMKKRVDLARAYASNPNLLLLDEPFASLDVITQESMQMLLLEAWLESRRTVIFVTHDVEEAIFLSQRVAVMSPRPGRIRRIFDIPFGITRTPDLKLSSDFVQIRKEITSALSKEN